MAIKIALVDDDQNILASVSLALEAEGYQVDTYFDSEQALIGLIQRPPDLAILDIKMPRMDGTELLGKLRQKSGLPVIFLTSKDDELDEALGLGMGADDYITKPFSQRLLLARIKAVLCRPGSEALRPERGYDLAWGFANLRSSFMQLERVEVKLTVTEFLLLRARTAPGVKSRDQLMDAAYGDSVFLEDRTIDSHIKRIRRKFRAHDKSFDRIETLYGIGYKYKGDA